MTKQIKAFITRDDFVNNNSSIISDIYEISDLSLTYAKNKQQYYYVLDAKYSLYVFELLNATSLLQSEVNNIVNVSNAFTTFLSNTAITNNQQIMIAFVSDYNTNNSSNPITNFAFNGKLTVNDIVSFDYITFTVNNIDVSLWGNDNSFKSFYPNYEVDIVFPFSNFSSIVNVPSSFIMAIDNFNLLEFNNRIEIGKGDHPTTFSKILNIPYKVPNTTITKNCYFAFNIYGKQGNYDYILKLKLYEYLTTTLNINSATVEAIFPTILNINEFFITPRWDSVAIPTQVGQNGINSQTRLAFESVFDMTKFIKVYSNLTYLRDNTYNVPFDYNNLLLHITNGYYTEVPIRDFKTYYPDLITVSSQHPDFARMVTKTQHFVTLISNMLSIADCNSSTEFFNKLIQNTDYNFSIITRGNVVYLSIFYDQHQYYVIPKFEYYRNL